MAGELPFEKPLSELRKKIEELGNSAQRRKLILPMKLPAWKNDASSWKRTCTMS